MILSAAWIITIVCGAGFILGLSHIFSYFQIYNLGRLDLDLPLQGRIALTALFAMFLTLGILSILGRLV